MNPQKIESVEVNEAEDGLVVYDPEHDLVHHLNPSAAIVFDLCDGTRSVDEIAAVLAEVYGLGDPPVAEARASVEELVAQHLVDWPAQPGPAV